MAGMLAIAGPLIGAAGSIGGLLGGSPAENVQRPPMFNMPNMGAAADNAFGVNTMIGGMPNIAAQNLPFYQTVAEKFLDAPYGAQMLNGARRAADYGAGAAENSYNLGNFLSSQGQGLSPYANQILQAGFDPQGALYDRTRQQLLEQTRAGQAARGLGLSPFGQGLENKALSDFNIDWQNNLLGRMNTGAQGAAGLLGQGAQMIGQGVGMQAAAPGMMQSSSMMPYTAYNQIGNDQFGALDRWSAAGANAQVAPQQQFANWLGYIGAGNTAGGVANNNFTGGLNQAALGFNQNQQMGSNLGNSLAQLGKAWGSSGGSTFMPSSSFMSNGFGWG